MRAYVEDAQKHEEEPFQFYEYNNVESLEALETCFKIALLLQSVLQAMVVPLVYAILSSRERSGRRDALARAASSGRPFSE